MGKKLTKQEREILIIESFAKNFNMIKRVDETEIKKVPLTKLNSLLESDNTMKDLLTPGLSAEEYGKLYSQNEFKYLSRDLNTQQLVRILNVNPQLINPLMETHYKVFTQLDGDDIVNIITTQPKLKGWFLNDFDKLSSKNIVTLMKNNKDYIHELKKYFKNLDNEDIKLLHNMYPELKSELPSYYY